MEGVTVEAVAGLADWSGWVPFETAVTTAPMLPGVYLARLGAEGPIVYVGCAGDRSSNGKRAPQGLRGRLRRYASGKALASGLGEAAADRAFAEPAFIQARLAEAEAGRPARAAQWGREALGWFDLHLCWVTTDGKASAEVLERRCEGAIGSGLWNRPRRGGV